MKLQLSRGFKWFMGSGWFTFLLFCLLVPLSRHLVFSPADIQGRSDYRKFPIAVQNKSVPEKISFCTFEAGPPRDVDPKSKCSTTGDADPISPESLLMKRPSGQVPMVNEEPEFGWTRYTLLAGEGNSQVIETEHYYNSDSLVTRYRVTGNHVEPVSQIFATRGMNQLFIFSLPVLLLFARLLASLFRALAKSKPAPLETKVPAQE